MSATDNEDSRTFPKGARCTDRWCFADLEGQPIRHLSRREGAGSVWGPACAEHENWKPSTNA